MSNGEDDEGEDEDDDAFENGDIEDDAAPADDNDQVIHKICRHYRTFYDNIFFQLFYPFLLRRLGCDRHMARVVWNDVEKYDMPP